MIDFKGWWVARDDDEGVYHVEEVVASWPDKDGQTFLLVRDGARACDIHRACTLVLFAPEDRAAAEAWCAARNAENGVGEAADEAA